MLDYMLSSVLKRNIGASSCKKMNLSHMRPATAQVQELVEPPHDKTTNMVCAPSEDSDQPGRMPRLIKVFSVRMKKAWFLSYPFSARQRL